LKLLYIMGDDVVAREAEFVKAMERRLDRPDP
jgi:hypothetical protein